MEQANQFQYTKSRHLDQVSVLRAEMNDFSYGKHAHEEYSFGVTLAGRQDFFAGGVFHRSFPGNVIIFNPGEVHDGHSGGDDTLVYQMLYLHPDKLAPMLNCAGIEQNSDFQIPDTLTDNKQLRLHLIKMALLIEGDSTDGLEQECELYQIASCIASAYGVDVATSKRGKAELLLLRARDFIHDNIHTNTTLDEISQQANLSKYHFLRLFRNYFGTTPHQYMLNCKIIRAREDLEAGIPLDDLVFNYGFNDLSHFNRRFKPVFGMTPRQYQRHFLSS
ncbi:MAG: AraC family transcriptional regulator [Oceanospirillaceae bacterium]|nr:AraC family transcriptional regulator [Oceanospirillaceae bacterium]